MREVRYTTTQSPTVFDYFFTRTLVFVSRTSHNVALDKAKNHHQVLCETEQVPSENFPYDKDGIRARFFIGTSSLAVAVMKSAMKSASEGR